MSDWNAWHKILVQRIPTERKGPSDDDNDEDDDDDDGDDHDDEDDFSDSRSNRLLVIPPFSFLRYWRIGILPCCVLSRHFV